MRRFFIFICIAALTLMCACSKDQDVHTTGEVHFSASSVRTKTTFDPGTAKGSAVPKWEVGDKIAVYDGDKVVTVELKASDISSDGTTANFSISGLKVGSTVTYYAVYPASVAGQGTEEDLFVDSNGVFYFHNKDLSQDSKNSFFSAAKNTIKDGCVDFSFVYACSILHFTTTNENISYVKLKVPSGSKSLASDFTFNVTNSTYTEGEYKAKTSLRYNLPAGTGSRIVNFAIEPGTYANGFTIECYNSSNSCIYTYTSQTKSYSFPLGQYSIIQNL